MPQRSEPVARVTAEPAGLGRRLSALLYDTLLVIAIWMITLFVLVAATDGEPKSGWWVQTLLLIEWVGFYAYFESRGQTLGMRAWRLQLVALDGRCPAAGQVWLRLLVAPMSTIALGLGWIWALFDKSRQTWHDRASSTLVVVLPKSGSRTHGLTQV